MASIKPIEVSIKIIDPNWPMMCLALTSHSMRALGYLESKQPDLALEALRCAKDVCDLAMMVEDDPQEHAEQ